MTTNEIITNHQLFLNDLFGSIKDDIINPTESNVSSQTQILFSYLNDHPVLYRYFTTMFIDWINSLEYEPEEEDKLLFHLINFTQDNCLIHTVLELNEFMLEFKCDYSTQLLRRFIIDQFRQCVVESPSNDSLSFLEIIKYNIVYIIEHFKDQKEIIIQLFATLKDIFKQHIGYVIFIFPNILEIGEIIGLEELDKFAIEVNNNGKMFPDNISIGIIDSYIKFVVILDSKLNNDCTLKWVKQLFIFFNRNPETLSKVNRPMLYSFFNVIIEKEYVYQQLYESIEKCSDTNILHEFQSKFFSYFLDTHNGSKFKFIQISQYINNESLMDKYFEKVLEYLYSYNLVVMGSVDILKKYGKYITISYIEKAIRYGSEFLQFWVICYYILKSTDANLIENHSKVFQFTEILHKNHQDKISSHHVFIKTILRLVMVFEKGYEELIGTLKVHLTTLYLKELFGIFLKTKDLWFINFIVTSPALNITTVLSLPDNIVYQFTGYLMDNSHQFINVISLLRGEAKSIILSLETSITSKFLNVLNNLGGILDWEDEISNISYNQSNFHLWLMLVNEILLRRPESKIEINETEVFTETDISFSSITQYVEHLKLTTPPNERRNKIHNLIRITLSLENFEAHYSTIESIALHLFSENQEDYIEFFNEFFVIAVIMDNKTYRMDCTMTDMLEVLSRIYSRNTQLKIPLVLQYYLEEYDLAPSPKSEQLYQNPNASMPVLSKYLVKYILKYLVKSKPFDKFWICGSLSRVSMEFFKVCKSLLAENSSLMYNLMEYSSESEYSLIGPDTLFVVGAPTDHRFFYQCSIDKFTDHIGRLILNNNNIYTHLLLARLPNIHTLHLIMIFETVRFFKEFAEVSHPYLRRVKIVSGRLCYSEFKSLLENNRNISSITLANVKSKSHFLVPEYDDPNLIADMIVKQYPSIKFNLNFRMQLNSPIEPYMKYTNQLEIIEHYTSYSYLMSSDIMQSPSEYLRYLKHLEVQAYHTFSDSNLDHQVISTILQNNHLTNLEKVSIWDDCVNIPKYLVGNLNPSIKKLILTLNLNFKSENQLSDPLLYQQVLENKLSFFQQESLDSIQEIFNILNKNSNSIHTVTMEFVHSLEYILFDKINVKNFTFHSINNNPFEIEFNRIYK
ncbi:hypothetical protein DLAC_02684 [Tieghemostelium lacteum]|uniref:Uncharacterized protein n=1 Tax=Tieghemostelium lacteum TaxID=361077 RepID=A0A152A372_TIELA|nr:hypothetical protein DLAC_02684 [Tieghemostelium lacteum]|eukprot:KYR00654.1 hypothetical protein DLAC_02684 [Tieghemostelium lacteum]